VDLEPITLPGGFERDGVWQRTLWLRPLSGHEEALFAGRAGRGRQAAAITTLLTRTAFLDDDARPIGPDGVRELTVGDREAALLHLRRLTLGERLACVLTCPACDQALDLDVTTSALLLPPYAYEGQEHRVTLGGDGDPLHVRFRLPTGADQECLAPLAVSDPEAAVLAALRRCVKEVTDSAAQPVTTLPAILRQELPAVMARLDPQAELLFDATCPSCGAAFTVPFDTAEFLCREMRLTADTLLREVDALALHYHWSEADILAMTRLRRRRYLDLIAERAGDATP
jgi:hypothetical protein